MIQKKELTESVKADIRARRQKECFDICDRAAWVATLDKTQLRLLHIWRNAWLRAPETGIIPPKPKFVK